MERRIVNDERAVSPVIAVILMVAITVVLAAVLYVWASSFLGGTAKDTPTGGTTALKDSQGNWIITIVKINPPVSVNSVHWFLLDATGNTASDDLVSEIYGFHPGHGKAVIFVDNDFNGKLNPGDKFEVHVGEGDLGTVDNIDGYSFRMKFDPTGDVIGYDQPLG